MLDINLSKVRMRKDYFAIKRPHNPEVINDLVKDTYFNLAKLVRYCEKMNIYLPIKLNSEEGEEGKFEANAESIGQKNIYYEYISTQIVQYMACLSRINGSRSKLPHYLKPTVGDLDKIQTYINCINSPEMAIPADSEGMNMTIFWACCLTIGENNAEELIAKLEIYKSKLPPISEG